MNKFGFSFKLALNNIRKNGKFYIPYLLIGILSVTMFFNMYGLMANSSLPGGSSFKMVISFGVPVIAFFCLIFMLYTNSFLIKRRKKELGIYNILGMEKRHIARVITWETIISAFTCIVGGILLGSALNRLLFMALEKALRMKISIEYQQSAATFILTTVYFLFVFALILIKNLIEITKSKPIELLSGSNVGEKEPKVRWPITVIGLISLISGYVLAITSTDAVSAIQFFFIAVILVMIGTYCLFISGSIAILKLLKKNKNFYYKTRNFSSVSGMLYRMKQNAVGLANICILSTMVLVMLSTTTSLYAGMNDVIENRYPADVEITVRDCDEDTKKEIARAIEAAADKFNKPVRNKKTYTDLVVSLSQDGNDFNANLFDASRSVCMVSFYAPEEFKAYSGVSIPDLADDEIAVLVGNGTIGEKITLFGKEYKVRLLDCDLAPGKMAVFVSSYHSMILSDQAAFDEINRLQIESYGKNASAPTYNCYFDIPGTDEDTLAVFRQVKAELQSDDTGSGVLSNAKGARPGINLDCKQESRENVVEFFGGFLFLGIYLGFLFLMDTVLIIYYKQLVEGYDDKERFSIMQKVGMSKDEVQATIKRQILIMFFLPLVTAGLHLAFAFPMLTHMIAGFGLTNIPLFALCTAITLIVYGIVYAFVYKATAKTYYNIISE